MNGKSLNILKLNVKWFALGIFLVILGYLVLGYTSETSQSFETRLYPWHKMTLAPILLLLGYACIGMSIMIRKKNNV